MIPNGEAKAIIRAAGAAAVAHDRAKTLLVCVQSIVDARAIHLAEDLVAITRTLNTELARAAIAAAERLGGGTREMDRLIESATIQAEHRT